MSRNLRLQYSGLIIFSSQLIGVATGLIFTLLLTRSMNVHQYGVWSNIFDYTAYFAIFSGLLPFWATRFVARSKEGAAKTSTVAQLVDFAYFNGNLLSRYFPDLYFSHSQKNRILKLLADLLDRGSLHFDVLHDNQL